MNSLLDIVLAFEGLKRTADKVIMSAWFDDTTPDTLIFQFDGTEKVSGKILNSRFAVGTEDVFFTKYANKADFGHLVKLIRDKWTHDMKTGD